MKTNITIWILLLFLSNISTAQFIDDIEWINNQCPSPWDGWNTNICPLRSQAQAHSPSHSILIPNDGLTDVLLDLGNKIIGEWGLEFWMFIPSGQEAYFNLQGVVPVGSGEWIVGNIFFNQDTVNPGVGLIDDCVGAPVTFNFPHNQWFKIVMNFDISTGIGAATWQFNVNGVDVLPVGTPFTNNSGTYPTSLGGIDFFSISTNNEYYLDDFLYTDGFIDPTPSPLVFTDDMEVCTTDGEPLPSGHWVDWGCGGGPGCDIVCSSAQAHSGSWSGLIPGDGTTDVALDLGNKIFGQWGLEFWAYIPNGKEAFWTILQTVPICSCDPNFNFIFFNQDLLSPGVGHVDDPTLGIVNFNFPHDEWFKIVMNFDISSGISDATWQFNVNGVNVIPTGTPFTYDIGQPTASLGGINFFSISSNNECYLDDFNYINGFIDPTPSPLVFTDDIEWAAGNCPTWWNGGFPCPGTSESYSHSPTHAILMPGDGTSDVILDLGNKIFGEWGLEFWMYIPSGKEGYFNLQGVVPIGSGEWIVGNIFFNQDTTNPGVGLIDDSALGNVYFNFPHDEWFKIVMNFDISTGIGAATWQFNVNGVDVLPVGTPFTDNSGTYPTSLGGIDFFSISTNNEYYLDDFNYTEGFLGVTDMFSGVEFTIFPNPVQEILQIESTEPIHRIIIYSIQGTVVLTDKETKKVDVSTLQRGLYFIEIETNSGKGLQKVMKY
ncbi:MAG: T9SS type A sorting domain-containing protein [Flavobacteriaceae bacterium]|nr:T9SS type A sorting domain-containing protein [Flavobacteriaceae bacterium]